ncbi:MAG: DNA adenine methylase [Erythrobacter sp.]|nr:DNA adenine methylase [Erythrobacter sp.]
MRIRVPPIKTQGIKTKLVPFIRKVVDWTNEKRWVEPFMGSGVVAFNMEPQSALMCDANPHLIDFYRSIQNRSVCAKSVREFLELEGESLRKRGSDHFYEIRSRFNKNPNPFDFLFLNRSCFNGMIRFNRKGAFNVPFCRKPDRFRAAYITKIVNQIDWVADVISRCDFEFKTQDWRVTLSQSSDEDFVYLDPPYVARTTDYHGSWSTADDDDLAALVKKRIGNFALSTWLENRYRRNSYVDENFSEYPIHTQEHFYHLGATETLRNSITEALIISQPTVKQASSHLKAA